jgi:hypothetical protein
MGVVASMSGKANDEGRTGGEVTGPNDGNPGRRLTLEGTVVRYEDKPDECTLHPADPTDRECTTAWITAKEDSYVSAAAWR